MVQVVLTGGAVYTGPNFYWYSKILENATGKTAEVIWKEGSFYYVSIASLKEQGYISAQYVELPSGANIRTVSFTTDDKSKRYVSLNAVPLSYLGEGYNFKTIDGPERSQQVDYLGEKSDDGVFAFIDYRTKDPLIRCRAWFPANYLVMNQPPTPGNYKDGNVIDDTGDIWKTPNNGWASNTVKPGHLGLDIHRCNSAGYTLGSSAQGKNVYAAAAGTVVASANRPYAEEGNGSCLVIKHETAKGNSYYTTYCHLSSLSVTTGDTVYKHQVIGTMGMSGNALVVHIHLHITEDNLGVDAVGYYRNAADVETSFSNPNYQDYKGSRYFNPTEYFTIGESFIDNYHT